MDNFVRRLIVYVCSSICLFDSHTLVVVKLYYQSYHRQHIFMYSLNTRLFLNNLSLTVHIPVNYKPCKDQMIGGILFLSCLFVCLSVCCQL